MYITYIDDPLNLVHIYGNEGIGAQYQRIVALISIARRHNLKYIHIPIKIGHNYNNEVEWDEKWEKMFNIKKLTNNDEIDSSVNPLILSAISNIVSNGQVNKFSNSAIIIPATLALDSRVTSCSRSL